MVLPTPTPLKVPTAQAGLFQQVTFLGCGLQEKEFEITWVISGIH